MYHFDFASVFSYQAVLLKGVFLTIELIAVGASAGVAVGIVCAWGRTFGPRWFGRLVFGYIELIRNTPFLIQLFFIFFALPTLGLRIPDLQAAMLAMAINLGAYSAEIIRAGISATPKGQIEAAESLAMPQHQIFLRVVLKPSFARIWPALNSQIILVMLGSAACSQISVEELTYAANHIQAQNYRAFESFLITTAIYLALATGLHQLLKSLGGRMFQGQGRK